MIYTLLIFVALFFAARYVDKQGTKGIPVLGRKINAKDLVIIWTIQLIAMSLIMFCIFFILF